MKDRKRRRHHQELLQQLHNRSQLSSRTEGQPTLRPQVKLFSLAMTALDTFAQAKVNAINSRNEIRPRVTALINGIKINLLYDTGAMSSCLMPETYKKHFCHKKLDNKQNVSASAAGNVDLDVRGTAAFEVSIRGATLNFLSAKGSTTTSCPLAWPTNWKSSTTPVLKSCVPSPRCPIHWSCISKLYFRPSRRP